MMRDIHKFCSALDQKVNRQKSKMLVFSNINPTRAKELSCAAYTSLTNDFGKYLGTPMLHGRVQRTTYSDLCSKLLRKLDQWSNKFLSMAGRVSLVQAVTNTMALYIMQTTLIPDNVAKEIDKLNFICGRLGGERKIHAITGAPFVFPKTLEVYRLERPGNLICFTCQAWLEIVARKGFFLVEILWKKYLQNNDLFSVKAKSSDSHIWSSILKNREVLAKRLAMVVNDGLHTKFWLDSWLPCGPLIGFVTRDLSLAEIDLPVACFCDDYGNWDLDSRTDSLPMQVIQKTAPYSIDPSSTENDKCLWTLTSSGEFTVKSAYESLKCNKSA